MDLLWQYILRTKDVKERKKRKLEIETFRCFIQAMPNPTNPELPLATALPVPVLEEPQQSPKLCSAISLSEETNESNIGENTGKSFQSRRLDLATVTYL